MFFSKAILTQNRLTPETIYNSLSLPRIEYAQALFEWYQEISKIEIEECEPPPGFPPKEILVKYVDS